MPGSLVTLRELVGRNKRLKGLSLLLSLLTWYIIQDTISFEIEIPDIHLQIRVQDGMAILNQSISTVDVTLRGSQEDIQLLDPRRLQAVVELSGDSSPLPQEIQLTPAMIKGIRGVRAIAVHPSSLLVTLDRQDERRVPVKGRTTGAPLFGQVEAVLCDPSIVLLRGPAAKLKTTDCVYAQPVDVDGRVESFVRRCMVQAPGDNWVASLDPAEVQVKVVISGKSAGKQLKNVPVNTIMEPGHLMAVDVEPPSVDVTLTSRLNESISADTVQVRVFADCIGLNTPGLYTVPVHVQSAGGVSAVVSPSTVKVTVRMPGEKRL
ncbi:MAG: CdaR family protein [bacterium]